MLNPKFEINLPPFLKWLNIFTMIATLCALLCWQAPLSYRLISISIVIILAIRYYFWFNKVYLHRYPLTLRFSKDHWQLNDKAIKINSASLLTPYYAVLKLKDLNKKSKYIVVSKQSFKDRTDYHHFIRCVKIHRGSF